MKNVYDFGSPVSAQFFVNIFGLPQNSHKTLEFIFPKEKDENVREIYRKNGNSIACEIYLFYKDTENNLYALLSMIQVFFFRFMHFPEKNFSTLYGVLVKSVSLIQDH